jgi:hypothetical protein
MDVLRDKAMYFCGKVWDVYRHPSVSSRTRRICKKNCAFGLFGRRVTVQKRAPGNLDCSRQLRSWYQYLRM